MLKRVFRIAGIIAQTQPPKAPATTTPKRQPPDTQAQAEAPPMGAAKPASPAPAPLPGPAATLPESERQSLAARAVGKIRKVLPDTQDIRMVFETPLHVVADGYSWVAKKISP